MYLNGNTESLEVSGITFAKSKFHIIVLCNWISQNEHFLVNEQYILVNHGTVSMLRRQQTANKAIIGKRSLMFERGGQAGQLGSDRLKTQITVTLKWSAIVEEKRKEFRASYQVITIIHHIQFVRCRLNAWAI